MPPTAYILYSNQHRAEEKEKLLAAGKEKVSVADIAKAIGERWKALSDEEKATYKELAKAAAEQEQKAKADAIAEETEQEAAPEPGPSNRPDHLPISTIRKIVLADSEVSRAAHDALLALTLTAERLIGVLATRSARNAQAGKRRTIRLDDVAAAVRADKRLVGAGLPEVLAHVKAIGDTERTASAAQRAALGVTTTKAGSGEAQAEDQKAQDEEAEDDEAEDADAPDGDEGAEAEAEGADKENAGGSGSGPKKARKAAATGAGKGAEQKGGSGGGTGASGRKGSGGVGGGGGRKVGGKAGGVHGGDAAVQPAQSITAFFARQVHAEKVVEVGEVEW